MTGSNVRHSAAAAGGNVATPHARGRRHGARRSAPFESDNTNPAGGINSSAEDMAKWLRVQLSGGMLADGSRLFSAQTARQLTSIVTPIPIGDPPPELPPLKTNFHGYALGFDIRDYRGHKIVMHTGGLPGYVSRVAMIPDLNVGVAVLTNQESGEAFDSIAYRVLDSLSRRAGVRLDRRLHEGPRARSAAAVSAGRGRARRPAATPRRSRRCRSPDTPAPTATPGTATSRSPKRAASW